MESKERTSSDTLAIIHTTALTVEPLRRLAEEFVPGIRVLNWVDDSILPQLASGDAPRLVFRRWMGYVWAAEERSVACILNACSSIGELVAMAAPLVAVPIVRIDAPMAALAVRDADRVTVMATLATTLGPTTRLLEEEARRTGRGVEIDPVLCDDAYRYLADGDPTAHDRAVLETIRRTLEQSDRVVLAQASMARVANDLDSDQRERVLSSPRLGMAEVARIVGECGR